MKIGLFSLRKFIENLEILMLDTLNQIQEHHPGDSLDLDVAMFS